MGNCFNIKKVGKNFKFVTDVKIKSKGLQNARMKGQRERPIQTLRALPQANQNQRVNQNNMELQSPDENSLSTNNDNTGGFNPNKSKLYIKVVKGFTHGALKNILYLSPTRYKLYEVTEGSINILSETNIVQYYKNLTNSKRGFSDNINDFTSFFEASFEFSIKGQRLTFDRSLCVFTLFRGARDQILRVEFYVERKTGKLIKIKQNFDGADSFTPVDGRYLSKATPPSTCSLFLKSKIAKKYSKTGALDITILSKTLSSGKLTFICPGKMPRQ